MNNFNNNSQNQWGQPYYNAQQFTYPQQFPTSPQYSTIQPNQNGMYKNSYQNTTQQNQSSDSILKYNAHDL